VPGSAGSEAQLTSGPSLTGLVDGGGGSPYSLIAWAMLREDNDF
jgi:hypothetical protein